MILTNNNLDLVSNLIKSLIADENGRGEFDNETSILSAVEKTINLIYSGDISNRDEVEILCEKCGVVVKYLDCYDDGDFDQQFCVPCAKKEGLEGA